MAVGVWELEFFYNVSPEIELSRMGGSKKKIPALSIDWSWSRSIWRLLEAFCAYDKGKATMMIWYIDFPITFRGSWSASARSNVWLWQEQPPTTATKKQGRIKTKPRKHSLHSPARTSMLATNALLTIFIYELYTIDRTPDRRRRLYRDVW